MKKIIDATTLSLGLIGLSACGGGTSENVEATKAGKVTKDDIYEDMISSVGGESLKKLMTLKVLEDKYEVSEEDIDKELEDLKEQVGDEFDQVLAMQGVTEDELRTDIKANMLQEQAITEDIEIDDEELKEYYDRMNTEIEARHILVEDEDKAKDIKKKLDDDEDFAKLAKKHSVDEGSAEEGGDVGYFSVGSMVAAFEDAAFTMEIGEISDRVQSAFGYHIIEVLDIKESDENIVACEDKKYEIRRKSAEQKVDKEAAAEKIDKLLDDADIDIKEEELEDIFEEDEQEM